MPLHFHEKPIDGIPIPSLLAMANRDRIGVESAAICPPTWQTLCLHIFPKPAEFLYVALIRTTLRQP
jgi:hypothetical protein